MKLVGILFVALFSISAWGGDFEIFQLARVNLDSAGTAQALSSTEIKSKDIVLIADPGNSGTLYIGSSAVAVTSGIPLAAGASVNLSALVSGSKDGIVLNLNQIYVDGTTTGDDIRVVYFQ